MYNCALWTLTPTLEKKIDAFQRRQLRIITGFQWPKKITNEELYKITRTTPWNTIIQEQQMCLLGHICRLLEETPAKQALSEATTCHKKRAGRPKSTWLQQIRKDLLNIGIAADQDFQNITELASDRNGWRAKCKCDLRNGRQLSAEE